MAKPQPPKPEPVSKVVSAKLVETLDRFLADPAAAAAEAEAAGQSLDSGPLELLEAVLKEPVSYRDGVMIQLAWGLEEPEFDHTQKGAGGRMVAAVLGEAAAKRHIRAVKDAYQNIGKNSPNLARGNVPAFDDLLRWMNGASAENRTRLLVHLVARTALTARPVLPMPVLARASLTFARVALLFDELLATPSGGSYEQFGVAAFLQAAIEEFDLGGPGGLHVRTKNINASDASSGAAADVQIMRGGRHEEVFEVSASAWQGKLTQALQAAELADLRRATVLAYGDDLTGLNEALKDSTKDVSVMDVRSFLRVLIGVLKTPGREAALREFYDRLARHQPDLERVNRYVELLRSHSLAAE